MKIALITGVTGQDGSYLAEFLLDKGYRVFGFTRQEHPFKSYMKPLIDRGLELVYGDLRDKMSIDVAITKTHPDEIYNLGAQSFVPPSWLSPQHTFDVNTGGLSRILETVERASKKCKVYQASTSEMFGSYNGPAYEKTPMQPTSPYGVAKYAAHKLCAVYRAKGLFVVSGILFNHESPRRGTEMVTQKVCQHVAKWKVFGVDKTGPLELGNMESLRDWGYAGDYVQAMWRMMQHDEPRDFVIGTGVLHSIKDLVSAAMDAAELDFVPLIETDPSLIRPSDIRAMHADPSDARSLLAWDAQVDFKRLIKMMVDAATTEYVQRNNAMSSM